MVSERIKWLFKMLNIYKLFYEIAKIYEIYEVIDGDGGDRQNKRIEVDNQKIEFEEHLSDDKF